MLWWEILGEVCYAPEGLQAYNFEPKQERFQELRQQDLDIVEIEISETDGQWMTSKKESKSMV